jgi:hypothetical protein
MCPLCFSTLAMVVTGTVSGGGLAAIVAKKVRGHHQDGAETLTSQTKNQNKGEDHATENRLAQ